MIRATDGRDSAVGIARAAPWNRSGAPFPRGDVGSDEAHCVDARVREPSCDLADDLCAHQRELLRPRGRVALDGQSAIVEREWSCVLRGLGAGDLPPLEDDVLSGERPGPPGIARQRVDHIAEVDLGANAELDATIIAPRATIGAYSSTRAPKFEFDYYGFGYKGARIAFTQVYMLTHDERAVVIADLTRWMQSGALKHRKADVFSLEQITEAHEVIEKGGVIGNVVVVIYP